MGEGHRADASQIEEVEKKLQITNEINSQPHCPAAN
jgi:hypothetical protein